MKIETRKKAGEPCCTGTVVGVSGDQLTTTGDKGEKNHYTVASDAKITCQDKPGKLKDLKKGSMVSMTMCQDDKNKILAIDCD